MTEYAILGGIGVLTFGVAYGCFYGLTWAVCAAVNRIRRWRAAADAAAARPPASAPPRRVPQVLDGRRLQAAAEALAAVSPWRWRESAELEALIREGNAVGAPDNVLFFLVARRVQHPDFRAADDLIGRA